MKNKRKLLLIGAMVLMTSSLMAGTVTVQPAAYGRLGAWGEYVNFACQQVIGGNNWAAFVNGEEGEYRVAAEYDVRPGVLGFNSSQVTNATLNFSASPWGSGRHGVNVDQINANMAIQGNEMYGNSITTIFADGENNGQYSVDITAAFKSAMDSASESNGLGFLWYNNNNAVDGLPAPYSGTEPDWVQLDTGFNVGEMTITVTYANPVATPTFSPDGGTYATAQQVTITCDTTGATIRYTTDGSDPTENSPVYAGPVSVAQPMTLKARAFKDGFDPSDVKSAAYEIGRGTITITPAAFARLGAWGEYVGVACQQVIANANFSAFVDAEEGEYRTAAEFDIQPAKLGFSSSRILTATLKFNANPWVNGRHALTVDQIAAANLVVQGNEMYGNSVATVLANGWIQGAYAVDITDIFKTAMDNANPAQGIGFLWYNDNDASNDLPAPATGSGPNWVQFDTGFSTSDIMIEVVYGNPAATPVFTPDGGTFQDSQQVSISCETPGATIRYTTDGTVPTETSAEYTGPLTFARTTVLKARAFADGFDASPVKTSTFTVSQGVITIAPAAFARLGAFADAINQYCSQVIMNNNWAAWVAPNQEYRVAAEYDIRPSLYNLDPNTITGAKLKFTTSSWGIGRLSVVVDQITSNRVENWGTSKMYSPALATVVTEGTNNTGTYAVDITAALLAAMQNATDAQGLAYRWSNDNDADPITPFTGTSPDYVAVNSGYDVNGMTIEVGYDVIGANPAATPAITPNGGNFQGPQQVAISCSSPGAVIRYTIDGSYPTSSSKVYTAPFTIDHSMTIKAKAWATNFDSSPCRIVTFTLPPYQVKYSDEILINGDLSDWSDAQWLPMDLNYNALPFVADGGDVESASYAVKWGQGGTRVFVAVKVKDLAHKFTDTFAGWSARDAASFYIHTTGTTGDYVRYQEPAQMWAMGLQATDPNFVWTTCGNPPGADYPLGRGDYQPSEGEFAAAGRVDGEWIYYEAAMTPFEYFASRWNLDNPDDSHENVVSPLSAGQLIKFDAVVTTNNGTSDPGPLGTGDPGYRGIASSQHAEGTWDWNWSDLADRQLVRLGVQGTITLDGFSSSLLGQTATMEIRDSGNNLIEAHPLVLDAAGTYSFTTSQRGTFTLEAKVIGWMPKTQSVNITGGNDVVNFTLGAKLPGDANQDGRVNFSDYLVLSQNFGGTDKGWTEGDFNGDTLVNFSDYLILSQNFGTGGSVSAEEVAKFKAASANLVADEESGMGKDLGATLPCSLPAMALLAMFGLALYSLSSLREQE